MMAETFAYLVNRNGMKWKHLGVQWSVLDHLEHGRTLIVPNGMLLGLFALLPLWWVQKWNLSRGPKNCSEASEIARSPTV